MKDKEKIGITPAALVAALNGDISNAIVASTPGGIEAQEAEGQKDFVANETLPIECPRRQLESVGFVFGENIDDIFVAVQFPEGWKKEATDHSMWSNLFDEKGQIRGNIFYKAAFYDRSAHMSLNNKITVQKKSTKEYVQVVVLEDESVIHRSELVYVEQYSEEFWTVEETVMRQISDWLDEHYPDHNDCMAYW